MGRKVNLMNRLSASPLFCMKVTVKLLFDEIFWKVKLLFSTFLPLMMICRQLSSLLTVRVMSWLKLLSGTVMR